MARVRESKREYFDLGSDWKVENVREAGNLKKGIYFTLKVKGLILPNLKVVQYSGGDFIGNPQTLDKKSGEYYAMYYLYLSERDTEKVIGEAMRQLEKASY